MNGVVNCEALKMPFHSTGIWTEKPLSTWARPIVATATMSRGALAKRRMISTSIRPPSTIAMTSPAAMARK